MSADDTIIVLKSQHPVIPGKFEFRVERLHAEDNLIHKPDFYDFNKAHLRLCFKDCEVIESEPDARHKADEMDDELEKRRGYGAEYGIKYVTLDAPFPQD